MTVPLEPQKRRIRSGITAIVCSVLLVAWSAALLYLAIAASSNEVAATVAYVMFFASWIVIPLLVVGTLVFAIIALLLNPVGGKILGAIAIVLPIVVVLLFLNASGMTDLGFDLP